MAGEVEILMRGMDISLNNGSVAIPTLVPIQGLDKMTLTPSAGFANRRHASDGQVDRMIAVSRGNALTYTGLRQEMVTTGVLATGQAAVMTAADLTGAAANKLWQIGTPDGLIYWCNGWCEYTGFDGDNDTLMPWGFKLNLTSALTLDSVNPAAVVPAAATGEGEVLIRDCTLEINTTGSTYIPIEGISKWAHAPATTAQNNRHSSDGGIDTTMPVARNNVLTCTGLRQNNGTAQATGQAAVEVLAKLVGTTSEKSFRFKSAGATKWTFLATAELITFDGGNDDLGPWGVKLTCTSVWAPV